MSFFGDDPPEMSRHEPFDDDAIEAIFAGTTRDDHLVDLASFVSDVRMSAEAVPTPSSALAAALAVGISTEKGDLPATAASNVHGPARQVSGLSKWRALKMKIKGLLAGLGIAGKVALGAGLAAAATTGAGAAGILPGPVQHVVAETVGSVTPFSFPDSGNGTPGSDTAGGLTDTTSTTEAHNSTTTTMPKETSTTVGESTTVPGTHGGDGTGPTGPSGGDGNGGAVTPTTEHHGTDGSTPGDGTEPTTTPTTAPAAGGGGDNNNPESLSIMCEKATAPSRIYCQWTASTSPDHAHYVLLRITSLADKGRVLLESADALQFVDTTATDGTGYGYRVISLRSDGSVEAHSNIFTIMCCGGTGSSGSSGGDSPTTTTPTTQPHEATTTTTQPH